LPALLHFADLQFRLAQHLGQRPLDRAGRLGQFRFTGAALLAKVWAGIGREAVYWNRQPG